MRNAKIFYKIFFLFLVISVFTFYIINNYSDVEQRFGDSAKFRAMITLLPTIPYLLLAVLLIFGWRYQDIGLLIGTISLGLLYYAFNLLNRGEVGLCVLYAGYTVFPLNMAIASLSHRKKIFSTTGLFWLVIFAIEIYLILLLCHLSMLCYTDKISLNKTSTFLYAFSHFGHFICLATQKTFHISILPVPILAFVIFLFSLTYLFIRFTKKNNSLILGYFLTVLIIFFTFFVPRIPLNYTLFLIFSLIILLISVIDASFILAYVDELTGIPARRSLDEALRNTPKQISIAMLDIDNFKKFNDKYGHKTGDQVLRMIGGRLGRAPGNPKVYRYGGEEFTAIFRGKSVKEASKYMEEFREELAKADFVIREKDRKKHTEEDRGKIKKSKKETTKVTVSIGVAEKSSTLKRGEEIIKAADKALYKAKKAGRNQTKIYKEKL